MVSTKKSLHLLFGLLAYAPAMVFIMAFLYVNKVPDLLKQVDWKFCFLLGGAGWLILACYIFIKGLRED